MEIARSPSPRRPALAARGRPTISLSAVAARAFYWNGPALPSPRQRPAGADAGANAGARQRRRRTAASATPARPVIVVPERSMTEARTHTRGGDKKQEEIRGRGYKGKNVDGEDERVLEEAARPRTEGGGTVAVRTASWVRAGVGSRPARNSDVGVRGSVASAWLKSASARRVSPAHR